MTQPVYLNVDHGQQAWDAELQSNINVQRVSVIVPEYANFAALPAAASNNNCLAVTTDSNTMWKSDGTRWVPTDGYLVKDGVAAATVGGALQTLKTFTFPAAYLVSGDQIEFEAWGTFDDGAEDGEIFPTFDSTSIAPVAPAITSLNGVRWVWKCNLSVTGAATQEALAWGQISPAVLGGLTKSAPTGAISGALVFNFDADNIAGTNNDAVRIRGLTIKILPAKTT